MSSLLKFAKFKGYNSRSVKKLCDQNQIQVQIWPQYCHDVSQLQNFINNTIYTCAPNAEVMNVNRHWIISKFKGYTYCTCTFRVGIKWQPIVQVAHGLPDFILGWTVFCSPGINTLTGLTLVLCIANVSFCDTFFKCDRIFHILGCDKCILSILGKNYMKIV